MGSTTTTTLTAAVTTITTTSTTRADSPPKSNCSKADPLECADHTITQCAEPIIAMSLVATCPFLCSACGSGTPAAIATQDDGSSEDSGDTVVIVCIVVIILLLLAVA